MTARQKDAITWLQRVGEATPWAVKKAGFQVRMFDTLAEKGRIQATQVEGRVKPFNVYQVGEG